MRLALYVSFAAQVQWAVGSLVGERVAPAGTVLVCLYIASYVLSCGAFAAGLWRFGSVPASTGAARPARHAFACLASAVGAYLLCALFFVLPYSEVRRLGSWLFHYLVVLGLVVPFALIIACGGLLVRSLGAALRSLGEMPPAWAPWALGATIALEGLLIALPFVTTSVPPEAQGLVGMLAYLSASTFTLALASVMGRTARALDRRATPGTATR